MQLSKRQRNDIFAAVIGGGLEPAECGLQADEGVRIKHLPSDSYFEMWGTGDWYRGTTQVGDDPPQEFLRAGWRDISSQIYDWSAEVRAFLDTPDYWSEAQHAKELLAVTAAESGNSLFAPEEQAQISARMGEIKDYIRTTYELTSQQMAHVEERLDAAEEASKRIGRKDWLMAFNGAVFSLFLSDLIPQQAATHIVVMAITGLGHLFGIGGAPPILPPG